LKAFKKFRNDVLFALIACIYFFFNLLPLPLARRLGAGLGRLFFVLVPYERKKTLRTLAIGYPEKSDSERRRMASNVFANLGRGGAEFMRFPHLSLAELDTWVVEVKGLEKLQAITATGRGVVVVTAHVGHWEMIAAWTAQKARVAGLARQLYDERLDRALNEFRRGKGITVFPRNTSIRPILKWLKGGGVLGTLADQDTRVDSVFVDFYGREAKTPSGPAWLAAASGAALMTGFSRRLPGGGFSVEYQDEIPLVPGELSKSALLPAVQEYTRRTEAYIRQVPEQWVWNHDRWKSKKDEASTGWKPGEA
jgi:KDO2-lipid IV(A) lauroyltransferase